MSMAYTRKIIPMLLCCLTVVVMLPILLSSSSIRLTSVLPKNTYFNRKGKGMFHTDIALPSPKAESDNLFIL